jgi:hypothetical protein
MTTENTPSTHPPFWSRLLRGLGVFLRILLRLVFVLVLAIGLGAGIYYGVVMLVQRCTTNTSNL